MPIFLPDSLALPEHAQRTRYRTVDGAELLPLAPNGEAAATQAPHATEVRGPTLRLPSHTLTESADHLAETVGSFRRKWSSDSETLDGRMVQKRSRFNGSPD